VSATTSAERGRPSSAASSPNAVPAARSRKAGLAAALRIGGDAHAAGDDQVHVAVGVLARHQQLARRERSPGALAADRLQARARQALQQVDGAQAEAGRIGGSGHGVLLWRRAVGAAQPVQLSSPCCAVITRTADGGSRQGAMDLPAGDAGADSVSLQLRAARRPTIPAS
jgi:hypothetical protein